MAWGASPWGAEPWAAAPDSGGPAAHDATGALEAQAATVAGAATHLTLHTSTGALTAQAATVAGTADHAAPGSFDATGALAAQAATVAGTAAHLTLHAATGALAAGSASVSGAAVDETTFVPPSSEIVGGGGWAWASAPRKKGRYSYLSPLTREQMAERVRKQREALGILPKPAQKRIAAAVKKESRRPDPSLAPLAPVAVEVAQDTGAPLQAVIDAIRAAFEHQQGLAQARLQADMARGVEQQQLAAEQARAEAEAAEQAWQQRLVELRAADDELLRQDEEARQQAVATIRQVQKALMALLAA